MVSMRNYYITQIKNTKSIHVNMRFYNMDTTYQLFTGENSQRTVVPKLFLFVDPHNLAHINMDCPDDWYPKLKICVSELILDSYRYTRVAYIIMHCKTYLD